MANTYPPQVATSTTAHKNKPEASVLIFCSKESLIRIEVNLFPTVSHDYYTAPNNTFYATAN